MSITPEHAIEIVKAFAKEEPLNYDTDGDTYCNYCDYDNSRHTKTCPWRDARESLGMLVPEPEPPSKMPMEYRSLLGEDPASFAKLWEPKLLQMLRLSKQVVRDDE